MSAFRELAERTLGKAVHPAALDRLFELAPHASVNVTHRRDQRGTRVAILTDDQVAIGRASVHHTDQFDRKKGIDIAFRRALLDLKRLVD